MRDFVKSWQDGLAYCALLHSYKPEAIDFNSLAKASREERLNLAFKVAESLSIPQLMDPEDFGLERLSMMTYLSTAYKTLEGAVPEK